LGFVIEDELAIQDVVDLLKEIVMGIGPEESRFDCVAPTQAGADGR